MVSSFLGPNGNEIHFNKGERISLFDGHGLRIHYSDDLIRSMAAKYGLSYIKNWTTHSVNLAWVNFVNP